MKSARNKYVNLIQNSSQDLAELKERIKIMQNEQEILKNDSSERDKTLMDYKHIIQLEIHRKDRRYAKLNKLHFQMKQKNENLSQNQNQIKKLLMITMTVEKEMVQLRKQYELGRPLIRSVREPQLPGHPADRPQRRAVHPVREAEHPGERAGGRRDGDQEAGGRHPHDQDRDRGDQPADRRRAQPHRAGARARRTGTRSQKIIALKNELEIEKAKERKCAEELENPENDKRWRELEGEDPEQEALEAKIQVLEERLNYKKERNL